MDHSATLPSFFLAGYQKSASTWLYHCFKEHPEVFVPDTDAPHFLDIHYHKGLSWYQAFYTGKSDELQVGDTTPSYMRFQHTRHRMASINPNAKILVTLRNPIERGYSHYWHEKKKRKINYDFREAIGNNVDIFDDWIATGFYYTHLKHLQTLFPKDQICVMLYEDLLDSPQQFCQNVFRFLDIDPTFLPSVVNNRVNKAWYKPTLLEMIKNLRAGRAIRESEYQRGIDPQFRSQLREVFRDEIACLSALLSRDLSHWN